LDRRTEEQSDSAMEALSEALRLSFVLLRVLMVVFVGLFLLTGVDIVDSSQKGIVKIFGDPVRDVGPGLVFNWPYPVGEIEKVGTKMRTMNIDRFWMNVKKGEEAKKYSDRTYNTSGLEPGMDGYVITGDRKIVHLKLECRYRVRDAVAYVRFAADPGLSEEDRKSLEEKFYEQTREERIEEARNMMIEVAVNNAVVYCAATRRSDVLVRDLSDFLADVKKRTQQQLDDLMGGERGVEISEIQVREKIWPLAAYDAYQSALKAVSKKNELINQAEAEARKIAGVAGETAFIALAGEPWRDPDKVRQRTSLPLDSPLEAAMKLAEGEARFYQGWIRPYNLLGRLEIAEDQGRESEAEKLRAAAGYLIASSLVTGEARSLIDEAEADKKKIVQRVKAQEDLFNRLREMARGGTGDLLKHQLWMKLVEEILSEGIEKKFFLPGGGKIVIRIADDPEVEKDIRATLRKKDDKKNPQD